MLTPLLPGLTAPAASRRRVCVGDTGWLSGGLLGGLTPEPRSLVSGAVSARPCFPSVGVRLGRPLQPWVRRICALQKRCKRASLRGPRAIRKTSAPGIAHTRPPSCFPLAGQLHVPHVGLQAALRSPSPLGAETQFPAAQTSSVTKVGGGAAGGGPQLLWATPPSDHQNQEPRELREQLLEGPSLLAAAPPGTFFTFFSCYASQPANFRKPALASILVRSRPRPLGCGLREQGGSGAPPSYESYVWNSEGSRAFLSGCHCFLCSWEPPRRVESAPGAEQRAASAPRGGSEPGTPAGPRLHLALRATTRRFGLHTPRGLSGPCLARVPCGRSRRSHAEHCGAMQGLNDLSERLRLGPSCSLSARYSV